jgi:hypothetical protein
MMSALPSKADMCSARGHVCFGPIADIERVSDEHCGARQNNPDLCELARLCIDFDETGVLLDDDVVADGEAKASAFSSGFGREEGVEHLFFNIGLDASAVIANPDFHTIAKVFSRGSNGRLVVAAFRFISALVAA